MISQISASAIGNIIYSEDVEAGEDIRIIRIPDIARVARVAAAARVGKKNDDQPASDFFIRIQDT